MTALIVFYLLFPLIVIRLCLRFESMNKIGAVFVCYVIGAALGNSGGLPDGSAALQDTLSGATVAIALPLLLFSMDVKAWVKTAGKAILSMTGATIIIVAVAGLGSVIIADYVEDSWKLAGLAISVYTGGTPNMAAIKTALDVDPTTYIIMHTYDILINLIYLIFSITLAQKFFNRFLPRFEKVKNMISDRGNEEIEDINSYRNMLNVSIIKKLMVAMVLSFVILGVSLGTAALFPKAYSTSVTILMITSLGIGASFFTKIRQIEKTYQLGMYFILIFCLVVGSMANINDLVHINWILMFYISFCVFGTFILHAVFCKIFKIDTDTFIITSVSAICSPPFVPVVAQALNNKQIILSGLTTGIIGYAIGNYLGISFAYIFKAIIG
ncbi:MAG: hypothetical protein DRH34_01515 [Deltaproteobacteria bacterium]|nr:MAG: hypothetical protein DRH34_01515 [Deltaproteobacteria bacterium]RLC25902.1 MAG: hypothetical protein DRH93_00605 [Deltaproteobacteria bacterium]HGY11905.1 DUF819 family protein [Desulfobacterales bacterium]